MFEKFYNKMGLKTESSLFENDSILKATLIEKNFELRPGPWIQIRDQNSSFPSQQSWVSNSWEDTFSSEGEIPF